MTTPANDTDRLDYRRLFPPMVAEYIAEIEKHYAISTDFLTTSILSVAATAAGAHFNVSDGKYSNSLVLWFVLLAPSGANKTHALKLPTLPLRTIDEQLFNDYRARLDDYKASLGNLTGRAAAPGAPDAVAGAASAMAALEPICRSVFVDDCTDEKRNTILYHAHGTPLLSVYPEFSGFFAERSRYSADSSVSVSRLLKLYDCDTLKIDRKSGETMLIKNPKYNILGDLQTTLVPEVFGRRTFMRNGLNQRFLFTFIGRREKATRLTSNPDPDIVGRWDTMIRLIFDGTRENGRPIYPADTVTLSPEADAIYNSFWSEHEEKKLAAPVDYEASIHSKLQIQILRLAGVLHALWCYADMRRDPTVISADVMERAWSLAEYFEGTAYRVSRLLDVRSEVTAPAAPAADPVDTCSNQRLIAEVVRRFSPDLSQLLAVTGLSRNYKTRVNEQLRRLDRQKSADGVTCNNA